jgi:hypothetical protein
MDYGGEYSGGWRVEVVVDARRRLIQRDSRIRSVLPLTDGYQRLAMRGSKWICRSCSREASVRMNGDTEESEEACKLGSGDAFAFFDF